MKDTKDAILDQDTVFRCLDCGEQYILTIGEAERYKSLSLSIPKRCYRCRQQRRAEKEEATAARWAPEQQPQQQAKILTKHHGNTQSSRGQPPGGDGP